MFVEEMRRAVQAAPRSDLPRLSGLLWKAWAAGAVDEDDAQGLAEAIQAKKIIQASPSPRRRPGSRPRAPESMERRRKWAASGRMPPAIAARFTQGEAAVLATVAAEASSHGDCRLTVGHVAAIAGVGPSTVRNALREAVKLGLVTIEERRVRAFRNLPNIVRVVSPEWLAWMRLGRQGGGYKSVNPTSTRLCLSSSGAAFPLGKRLGDKARGNDGGYSARPAPVS